MSQQPNFNDIIILDRYVSYGDRRIIFGNKTWEDFDREEFIREYKDINFNPNDGIETTLVLKSKQDTDNFEESTYLVVGDKTANKVYSRWFIMDATRLSKGMFSFKLRRDVVAEFINNNIGNTDYSPFYVEKGILPESSPLIVNSEGLSLNQIKVSEQKIYDFRRDKCGWIVGYIAANHGTVGPINTDVIQGTLDTTTFAAIASATGIDATDLEGMLTAPLNFTNGEIRFEFGFKLIGQDWPPYQADVTFGENLDGGTVGDWFSTWKYDHCLGEIPEGYEINFLTSLASGLGSNLTNFKSAIQSAISLQNPGEKFYLKSNLEALRQYEGEYILYNGTVYRIHITGGSVSQHAQVDIHDNDVAYFNTAVGDAFNDVRTASGNADTAEYEDWEMYLMPYSQIAASIELEEVEVVGTTTYSFTLPSSANHLNDAPYLMFAMPLSSIRVSTNNIVEDTPDRNISLKIASQIAIELGDKLYDIQVLPYCPPLPGVTNMPLYFWNRGTESVDYSLIKKTSDSGSDYSGVIWYCKTSNFSRTIRSSLQQDVSLTMKQKNMKIESQTDFYRLCSPNYNGVFEFNLAKNGGSVNYWNIDCTYKPFNPFIRVSPEFKFLYGQNYQDGRGLICGGDFSLPIVKDRWIEYEMNNKNFASIFSREIQNLEFTQEQERLREKILAVAGTVGGTTGGAVAGGKAGGAYGAVAGGLMGAGAGVVGGALDIALGEARRGETRQYAIDRFNLGLGNIKALPQSLTRTSTLNVINKIHPFVERYTCTDEEVKALENKITYDGMTVGKIATLNGFTSTYGGRNYFKGQLIKTFETGYDAHFFEVLNEEFMKGVYI